MKNKQIIYNKQKTYFGFLKLFQQNCRYCIFKSNSFGVCSSCFKYFKYFIKPFYTYIKQIKIISFSRYTSRIRREILNFKLKDNRELSRMFVLSVFNYPNLISDLSKYEYIVYVPMDKEKEKDIRGYNQSKLLAKDLSMFLGIPVIDLVEKVKKNRTQSTISKKERYLNVKNVYSINKKIKLNLNFKNILLVDDIFTTGATIFEIISKIKEEYNNVKADALVLSKTISIVKNYSSLIDRKYKYLKLINNRKSLRKRLLEEKHKNYFNMME